MKFLKKYWKYILSLWLMFILLSLIDYFRNPDLPRQLLCKPNPTSMYTDIFKFGGVGLFVYRSDNNPNTNNEMFIRTKKNNEYHLKGVNNKSTFVIRKSFGQYKSDYGLYYEDGFKYMSCWSKLPSASI